MISDCSNISMLRDIKVSNSSDATGAITAITYPDLLTKYTDTRYLKKRAIFSLRNDDVTKLNGYIIN